jgi:hypothetical protein
MHECLTSYPKIVVLPSVACAKVDVEQNILIVQGYLNPREFLNNPLLLNLGAFEMLHAKVGESNCGAHAGDANVDKYYPVEYIDIDVNQDPPSEVILKGFVADEVRKDTRSDLTTAIDK